MVYYSAKTKTMVDHIRLLTASRAIGDRHIEAFQTCILFSCRKINVAFLITSFGCHLKRVILSSVWHVHYSSHCQQSSPTPVTMALHYFGIYVWYGVLLPCNCPRGYWVAGVKLWVSDTDKRHIGAENSLGQSCEGY